MHLGYQAAEIISVEGSPEIAAIARENMNEFATNPSNMDLVVSSFSDYLSNLDNKTFDLVYIDGHHEGEALRRYLDQIIPHTHEQTLFLLDDIRWNDDMFKAWNELIADERFHVSIDFFRMGVLSRRPTQANPRPCSPARAASTAALSARILVWNAMPSITEMMSTMRRAP